MSEWLSDCSTCGWAMTDIELTSNSILTSLRVVPPDITPLRCDSILSQLNSDLPAVYGTRLSPQSLSVSSSCLSESVWSDWLSSVLGLVALVLCATVSLLYSDLLRAELRAELGVLCASRLGMGALRSDITFSVNLFCRKAGWGSKPLSLGTAASVSRSPASMSMWGSVR